MLGASMSDALLTLSMRLVLPPPSSFFFGSVSTSGDAKIFSATLSLKAASAHTLRPFTWNTGTPHLIETLACGSAFLICACSFSRSARFDGACSPMYVATMSEGTSEAYPVVRSVSGALLSIPVLRPYRVARVTRMSASQGDGGVGHGRELWRQLSRCHRRGSHRAHHRFRVLLAAGIRQPVDVVPRHNARAAR